MSGSPINICFGLFCKPVLSFLNISRSCPNRHEFDLKTTAVCLSFAGRKKTGRVCGENLVSVGDNGAHFISGEKGENWGKFVPGIDGRVV